jgi:hypothetical protein
MVSRNYLLLSIFRCVNGIVVMLSFSYRYWNIYGWNLHDYLGFALKWCKRSKWCFQGDNTDHRLLLIGTGWWLYGDSDEWLSQKVSGRIHLQNDSDIEIFISYIL